MLGFTNPMWSYLVAPMGFAFAGYFFRGWLDRVAPLEDDR